MACALPSCRLEQTEQRRCATIQNSRDAFVPLPRGLRRIVDAVQVGTQQFCYAGPFCRARVSFVKPRHKLLTHGGRALCHGHCVGKAQRCTSKLRKQLQRDRARQLSISAVQHRARHRLRSTHTHRWLQRNLSARSIKTLDKRHKPADATARCLNVRGDNPLGNRCCDCLK